MTSPTPDTHTHPVPKSAQPRSFFAASRRVFGGEHGWAAREGPPPAPKRVTARRTPAVSLLPCQCGGDGAEHERALENCPPYRHIGRPFQCVRTPARRTVDRGSVFTLPREGAVMADKSPRQHMSKKAGKSLKEKRAEKHLKAEAKNKTQIVPPGKQH